MKAWSLPFMVLFLGSPGSNAEGSLDLTGRVDREM